MKKSFNQYVFAWRKMKLIHLSNKPLHREQHTKLSIESLFMKWKPIDSLCYECRIFQVNVSLHECYEFRSFKFILVRSPGIYFLNI